MKDVLRNVPQDRSFAYRDVFPLDTVKKHSHISFLCGRMGKYFLTYDLTRKYNAFVIFIMLFAALWAHAVNLRLLAELELFFVTSKLIGLSSSYMDCPTPHGNSRSFILNEWIVLLKPHCYNNPPKPYLKSRKIVPIDATDFIYFAYKYHLSCILSNTYYVGYYTLIDFSNYFYFSLTKYICKFWESIVELCVPIKPWWMNAI